MTHFKCICHWVLLTYSHILHIDKPLHFFCKNQNDILVLQGCHLEVKGKTLPIWLMSEGCYSYKFTMYVAWSIKKILTFTLKNLCDFKHPYWGKLCGGNTELNSFSVIVVLLS